MRPRPLRRLLPGLTLAALVAGCPAPPDVAGFPCRDDDDCVPGWRCAEDEGARVCVSAALTSDGGGRPLDGGAPDAGMTDGGAGGEVDAGADGGGTPPADGGAVDAGPSPTDGGGLVDAGSEGADAGEGGLDGGGDDDAGGGPDAGGAPIWLDAASPWRAALLIDNSGVTSQLTRFPALFVVDGSQIPYGQTQSDGDDLRFFDDDGTALPHDVERWNESASSFVWVRLPSVPAPPRTERIWVYWGDSGAADVTDPAAVWGDYEAVYHLDTDEDDATGRYPSGEGVGTSVRDGIISRAAGFDGSGDFIRLGSDVNMARAAPALTLTAWVRLDAYHATDGTALISLSVDGGGSLTAISRASLLVNDEGVLTVVARATDGNDPSHNVTTAPGAVPLGAWRHLVGVIDFADGRIRVYVDGALAGEQSVSFPAPASPDTPSTRALLGIDDDETDWDLNGRLDEVRVERRARSTEWIRLQHRSMTGGLFTVGAPEARPEG